MDCLCVGTHNRDDNNLITAMIFGKILYPPTSELINAHKLMIFIADLHGSRLSNADLNESQTYVHHLKELGYIAMELSLNVREIRQRVADHEIEDLIGVGGHNAQRFRIIRKTLFLGIVQRQLVSRI